MKLGMPGEKLSLHIFAYHMTSNSLLTFDNKHEITKKRKCRHTMLNVSLHITHSNACASGTHSSLLGGIAGGMYSVCVLFKDDTD